ncbi:MAG TPA: hypothetical protein VGJ91_05605, partial [Polyangiaceae bacterium]
MRFFAWLLVGGGLVLQIAGCGSSSDATADSHAGAANGSAGDDSGMAGSSAGSPAQAASGASSAGSAGAAGAAGASLTLGDSKTEACIAYAVASCERHAVCRNEPTEGCLSASASCPDLVFSTGSTRTIAGVKACAEDFKSFSCERLLNGESPACVTPGTRQPGESCAFASQCESLDCKGKSACGVCAKAGAEEDSCAGPAEGCGVGLYCSDTKQKCLVLPDSK